MKKIGLQEGLLQSRNAPVPPKSRVVSLAIEPKMGHWARADRAPLALAMTALAMSDRIGVSDAIRAAQRPQTSSGTPIESNAFEEE